VSGTPAVRTAVIPLTSPWRFSIDLFRLPCIGCFTRWDSAKLNEHLTTCGIRARSR
jgi:hypothetical protein